MFTSALILSIAITPAAPPAWRLETTESQSIEAVLTYTIECPKLQAREWVSFVAKPPVLPCQKDIKTVLSPGAQTYDELSPEQRTVFRIRVPVKTTEQQTMLKLEAKYEATLFARKLVEVKSNDPKPARAPELSRSERAAALAERGVVELSNKDFQKWLKQNNLLREKDENDIGLARRAFLHIKKNFTYEYHSRMDRHVSVVCRDGKSDCGGMAALFVAILRTNKVPARTMVGRWAPSATR
jgi:transglutaminase-like putative cysteine protease